MSHSIGLMKTANRFATVRHLVRVGSDNTFYALIEADEKIVVVKVVAADLATSRRFSRCLLEQKSLLLAPNPESADGVWTRMAWDQLLAESLLTFPTWEAAHKWDVEQYEARHSQTT